MGRNFETDWFDALKNVAIEASYKSGEILSAQGDINNKVGFILSGKATASSYSVNGDETWVSEYIPGQFFGLRGLLYDQTTSLEIRAKKNLTVLLVSHDRMLDLMRENHNLCQAIATDLAARLNQSMAFLIDINTLSVKGRICAELLKMALPIGIDPDRQVIRPNPIFIDMARKLNSSRETVSRTISELQKRGIIARQPGALVIEDPIRLQDAIEYI